MVLFPWREKGRYLTQSYDKSPYTSRNVKRAMLQHKQRHKKVRFLGQRVTFGQDFKNYTKFSFYTVKEDLYLPPDWKFENKILVLNSAQKMIKSYIHFRFPSWARTPLLSGNWKKSSLVYCPRYICPLSVSAYISQLILNAHVKSTLKFKKKETLIYLIRVRFISLYTFSIASYPTFLHIKPC